MACIKAESFVWRCLFLCAASRRIIEWYPGSRPPLSFANLAYFSQDGTIVLADEWVCPLTIAERLERFIFAQVRFLKSIQ